MRSLSSWTGKIWPVVQRTCETATSRVRDVTAAAISSHSGGTTITRAPDTWSGPSKPKCSSLVVTTSSPGSRSSAARTILQPSVVEAVSATCSASTPTSFTQPSPQLGSGSRGSGRCTRHLPARPTDCAPPPSAWRRSSIAQAVRRCPPAGPQSARGRETARARPQKSGRRASRGIVTGLGLRPCSDEAGSATSSIASSSCSAVDQAPLLEEADEAKPPGRARRARNPRSSSATISW